jgi:hypothetical protein
MTPADRLRRIASAAPRALGDDGAWLANAIECGLLDTAAAVCEREAARVLRNQALRALAGLLAPGGRISAQMDEGAGRSDRSRQCAATRAGAGPGDRRAEEQSVFASPITSGGKQRSPFVTLAAR